MQWKMARPSRVADRFNRWALRHGFPLLARIAPRLPRWFNLAGARLVISVVMGLHHRPKQAIARNLARVLGEPEGSRRVRAAVRQMLYNFAYYWVDLFRFAQLPPERAAALVDRYAGGEHIAAALGAGRGALLLTAHLGNWELGGVFLRAFGSRPGGGLRARPVRRRRGGAPGAAPGDRRGGDPDPARREPGQPAGAARPAREPAGRAAGRPRFQRPGHRGAVLRRAGPISGRTLPSRPRHRRAARAGVHRLHQRPPLHDRAGAPIRLEATGDRDADVRRGLEAWVRTLEAAVRRWPTQWYTFFDYWPEATRGGGERAGKGPRRGGLIQTVAIAAGDRDFALRELETPLPLDALVPGPGAWEVEIGFGKGRYLLGRAAQARPAASSASRWPASTFAACGEWRGGGACATSCWSTARRSSCSARSCRAASRPPCTSTSPIPGRRAATRSGGCSTPRPWTW